MARMKLKCSRVALIALLALVVGLGAEVASSAPAGAESAATVHAFGGAPALGAPNLALNAPIVGIAATHSHKGYWLLASDGGIFSYGDAHFYGSTGAMHLNQPVVGIAPTPTGRGYWLVASDGGIFTFGDAHFYGSTGAMHLNQPIIGMASTPNGRGYWLVASDGGIFTFGNAGFHGSTGSTVLFSTIAGMATSHTGHGYWLASADGRIFNYGDAPAMARVFPTSPIVGIQSTPAGTGLWLVSSDGAVFTTGTAAYAGGANGPSSSVEQAVGIARSTLGHGYWVVMSPSGPPLPANSGSGRRIVYSNKQQRVWTVEANGQVSHTFLVSGRHGLPSAGVHQVYSKVPSSPSGDLTLPWTLRFAVSDRGNPIDFHGIPIDPSGHPIEPDSLLGTPQSHGCVRMSQVDAKTLWDWAEVGTVVIVTDIGY
jgi:lipoprotein-anchoring transpeptidase ErfK/SrfK